MAGKFCLWTFLLILSSTLLNFSASLPVRRESHNKCTEPDEIRDYAFVLKMMKMMMNNKDQEVCIIILMLILLKQSGWCMSY